MKKCVLLHVINKDSLDSYVKYYQSDDPMKPEHKLISCVKVDNLKNNETDDHIFAD